MEMLAREAKWHRNRSGSKQVRKHTCIGTADELDVGEQLPNNMDEERVAVTRGSKVERQSGS